MTRESRTEAARSFARRHLGERGYRALANARFVGQVVGSRSSIDHRRLELPPGGIDAEQLAATFELEHHSKLADDYFGASADERARSASDVSHLLKPFTDPVEAANHLSAIATLIGGLELARGQRVLDFGSGNGWTSRLLIQLGCGVTLCDVSPSALDLARRGLGDFPPITRPGDPPPEFLLFDGHRIDLPDGSIDRILCFDAFHHVANRAVVLSEMHRVLADGGRVGFHEPGPDHSRMPASQFEMANHGFLERDIRMDEIAGLATDAGFGPPRFTLAAPPLPGLTRRQLDRFLRSSLVPLAFRRLMWNQALGTRIFFLDKGTTATSDSRRASGLRASITVVSGPTHQADGSASYRVRVRNTGTGRWLPSTPEIGGVWLGLHRQRRSAPTQLDVMRWPLPGDGVVPEEEVVLEVVLPTPAPDERLTFDLVAEGVTWFGKQGSPTVDL